MKKELLVTNRLVIGIHEELISEIPHIYRGETIGIIGANGSGKSTLLRTIAGIVEPLSGSFVCKGSIVYVAQDDLHTALHAQTLAQYCADRNIALHAVIALLQERFEYNCSESAQLHTLSGGQRAMVLFACAFVANPNLLLLDEPTNHIDVFAKQALIQLLREYKGTVVCVSHDTWFLNAITKTLWIIKDGTIRSFSGNYREYQEELQNNEQARQRMIDAVQQEARKLRQARALEQKRIQRTARIARENKLERSSIRSTAVLKTWSQKAATRNKRQFDEKENEIHEKLQKLNVPKTRTVSGSILGTNSGGSIVRIDDATLSVFGKVLQQHVKLDIRYGNRIALSGRNGTGKTALVKAMLLIKGFVLNPRPYINPHMRIEYLDQQYQMVDPSKTVFENVSDFTGLPDERIRQHLSHFLFGDIQIINRKARDLSGGMIARLAFVMVTIAPIDLLILDEPTNNLDLPTIESITELLNNYRGALLVISHDVGFVEGVGIERKITFKTMDKTGFYV